MAQSIKEETLKMKLCAPKLANSTNEERCSALKNVYTKLLERKEEIFAANHEDMERAQRDGIPAPVCKRLKFDDGKLDSVVEGIKQLMELEDPIGKVTLHRELDSDLVLKRVTCPIGVIGVIFEARPDALVQIASLCIKSGNCAILKGGKETASTNEKLFNVIHEAVIEAGLPTDCMLLATQHSEIDELLSCNKTVDLLIPRGSNAFVSYIMNNTKIPVMGHADGICHIYVSETADFEKAISIIIDAKTQYVAACNAVETLLINRKVANDFLPALAKACKENEIVINGTKEVTDIIEANEIAEGDFKEYLALIVSIKLVDDVDEATQHINKYGSHHTDSIITENDTEAEKFMRTVDSAGVYQNCSTRFADGFRYGFGAEVGISTSKIHARGPVGLDGLVTYKYMLKGNGNIVDDYATGKKSFHHKDL